MGQALYRKYRSRSLDDVVGQEHVTQTLDRAIKKGRLSHAYLFTGPRGVGKTSVARILAHQVNNLPYDSDNSNLDIIEIDAASNRRIDEIRDLREKVSIAPSSATYKVYIIDEVHMLTREAFNALLKTLEEPPAHVIFILATTDVHKLPETIISRTQRFSFKPADFTKLVKLLKSIAKSEAIDISDEAVDLIAKHGDGSFRDSVSLLDQVANQAERITLSEVQETLGLPSDQAIGQLLTSATSSDSPATLISGLNSLYDQGFQATLIAEELGALLRHQMIDNKLSLSMQETLNFLDQLLLVSTSTQPERMLEIVLLRAKVETSDEQNRPYLETKVIKPKKESKVEAVPNRQSKHLAVETKLDNKPTSQNNLEEKPPTAEAAASGSLSAEQWAEVVKSLKKKHNTLYGIIRMAQPDFSETGKIRLAFGFSFHQKRLNEPANQKKLFDIIKHLTGQTFKIECIVDKTVKSPLAKEEDKQLPPEQALSSDLPTQPETNQDLSNVSNIFGNAELLES